MYQSLLNTTGTNMHKYAKHDLWPLELTEHGQVSKQLQYSKMLYNKRCQKEKKRVLSPNLISKDGEKQAYIE